MGEVGRSDAATFASTEAETDRLIIESLGRREEEALRLLIERCGRYVFGKALQILRDPQRAEEVAQDALLVLWWRPERFDPSKGSIRSFLIGVARFKAIDVVRHEETLRNRESLLTEAESFFESPPVDDEIEKALLVRSAIAELPLGKREVIFLAFYKGLSYREVGEVLGLPEGTAKSRIRDALLRLRRTLALSEGEPA